MMATHRTPADGEALGPAIRILVKRVMADPALSASSRTVMTWLLLEGREEAPSAADMGHLVGLTERSVRRAYAELKETGWLDPRRGWSEAPRADTPERRAVLEGGRTDLSADDLPSFREHIRMLEVIRDRALAKGRETTALSAEDKIGKAMGYNRPRGSRADKIVRANVNPPSATAGGGQGGGGDALAHGEFSSPPPPRPSPTPLSQREGGRGWPNSAQTGPEPAAAGSARDETGSNWLELAGLGSARNQARPEKLIPISDLLEKPIFAAEESWRATREHPAQRPFWLNGVSAIALAGGQNCPPAPGADVR